MKVTTSLSKAQVEDLPADKQNPEGWHGASRRAVLGVYGLALAISIALWLLAIRAPLNLDETGSYWQICAGIAKIWQRQFLFPSCLAYSYILQFWTRLFGTSEIALRVPSLLAMLGAMYVLHRSAREMFDRESSLLAAVIFCLHPTILFAAIDVRPYALGALSVNAAIYILIRLRYNDSNWLAALFGLSAACIVWFQFLFAVILPFLVVCFFVFKRGERRTAWRQFGVALVAFVLAVLLTVPGLLFLIRTRAMHVFDTAPKLSALAAMFAPGWMLPIFLCFVPIAFLAAMFSNGRGDAQGRAKGWQILLCVSLGPIPVLILYAVSAITPIHIFVTRYCVVSIPGIALCWALLLRRFGSQTRVLFCAALVVFSILSYVNGPFFRQHDVPWKYALQFVERNASADNAPVVMCSGFIESDYLPMPVDSAKTSFLFAPLSYYPLSVPVVPLPRNLNGETALVGSLFLEQASDKHERFLVLVHFGSYDTLAWIEQRASTSYTYRTLWASDGFEVVEFAPRNGPTTQKYRASR